MRDFFITSAVSAFLSLVIAATPSVAQTCVVIDGVRQPGCPPLRFLEVTSTVIENGVIEGANIRAKGRLVLSGSTKGTITVYPGGSALLFGTVQRLHVAGGSVVASGMIPVLDVESGTARVTGKVDKVSGAGTLIVQNGATIEGVRRKSCEVVANEISKCPVAGE